MKNPYPDHLVNGFLLGAALLELDPASLALSVPAALQSQLEAQHSALRRKPKRVRLAVLASSLKIAPSLGTRALRDAGQLAAPLTYRLDGGNGAKEGTKFRKGYKVPTGVRQALLRAAVPSLRRENRYQQESRELREAFVEQTRR